MTFCCRTASGQLVPDSYGNNATLVEWQRVDTPHFKIVFANSVAVGVPMLALQAEQIYGEYRSRLGTSPNKKIYLYYNGQGKLVSGKRARGIDDQYSIWRGNLFERTKVPGLHGLEEMLRLQIAYAFQEHIQYFPLDYWFYLFSRPAKSPWSDGFTSYLANPAQTPVDVSTMRRYWRREDTTQSLEPALEERFDTMLGRSQIHYFNEAHPAGSLQQMYSKRQKLVGVIPYFDFNPAFEGAYGILYDNFTRQWESDRRAQFHASQPAEYAQGDLLLGPKNVVEYRGAAVNQAENKVATIQLPDDGSTLPELRITGIDGGETALIAEGHFHRVMDWNTNSSELVFSKRTYDSRNGRYYYQLQLWNPTHDNTQSITRDIHAVLPGFSPDGKMLAFVEKTGTQNIVWLMDIETRQRRALYTFAEPVSVTHLDYHPEDEKILLSYRENGHQKVGILDVADATLSSLSVQSQVSLHAQWNPEGQGILFNGVNNQVPNIFRADVSGSSLTEIVPVTSNFYGAELLETARSNSGVVQALAKTDRDEIRFYAVQSQPGGDIQEQSRQSGGNIPAQSKSTAAQDLNARPYNAFMNIQWEAPFFAPYYAKQSDFGLAAYMKLEEPMRTHAFSYYGSISLADPFKSFFYSSYENNSFRPFIELSYNHFPSASGFFGKSREVQTSDIIAWSSLWKITGLSHDYTDWYFGLTLRHSAFDYFSTETLRRHHPDIFFNNRKTRQTDLKATLTWRKLKPSIHTLIHPLSGRGIRVSITASDEIPGSQTEYTRLNLDVYNVFPAFGSHRIYLYANGVMDIGEPAGRDYLSFSDNGNYRLPDEDFLGSINPGHDRYVRGYKHKLTGDRFLFGELEYRIPFQFDTQKKLLGFIPPARTVFTLFADGGVMGEARIASDREQTEYRYSVGTEIKRVFSIGGSFEVTYELGVGQALTQSFGPHPYFNIRSALAF